MTKEIFLKELKFIGYNKDSFYKKTGKKSALSGYRLDEELPESYISLLELLKELHQKDKIINALNTAISNK